MQRVTLTWAMLTGQTKTGMRHTLLIKMLLKSTPIMLKPGMLSVL